jgi:coenzyme F420-0:L-glutamate ligase / coenzyme F420-1:gamma-L-glutamate ligase
MASLSFFAPESFPLIQPGQPLLPIIADALADSDYPLADGDILVLAQKIVSKSENRFRDLATVVPTAAAREYAATCGKDPRFIQAVLDESSAVVRCVPNVFIVRHRRGFILANAGIDQSNIDTAGGELVLLLPEEPDRSAALLRQQIRDAWGVDVGVVISDSFGRPWRLGTTGVCIGCAGVEPIRDQRGSNDLYGRTLQVTQPAIADQIAGAACLLMGEASEGRPLVILRGGVTIAENRPALALIRPGSEDLFR